MGLRINCAIEDAPDPVAGPAEVVVCVKACALNYLDLWQRKGLPGIQIPMPHISGSDIAGIIESVGAGVEHLQDGRQDAGESRAQLYAL